MFLGPINVRATRKDVQLKVKEEYNSYRVRLSFLVVSFHSPRMFLALPFQSNLFFVMVLVFHGPFGSLLACSVI